MVHKDNVSNGSKHYVMAASAGEAIWFTGTLATIKASSAMTGNIFSMVEFLHPSGFSTPFHVHHNADEAFYILEGTIRGIIADKPWSADAGSFVWLPRAIPHGYAVVGDVPVRTLAMTIPSGFSQFVREAGDPAVTRTLPPPAKLNVERLVAAATRYDMEVLGPLVLP